jgi:hypothetical protein
MEQCGAPKRWYPTATLHGVTTQKTSAVFLKLCDTGLEVRVSVLDLHWKCMAQLVQVKGQSGNVTGSRTVGPFTVVTPTE